MAILHHISDCLLNAWAVLEESAPWLLIGFLLAGVIYVLLPTEKITSHLGKPGFAGVVKASLVGMPLPLCSCSVIPVASSLRKQGASRGATASFLISTPETGVDSISITYALLGPVMAVARPLAALITALSAGYLINRFTEDTMGESQDDIAESSLPRHEASCCDKHDPSSSFGSKIVTAIRYGLVDMFADLSHWLAIGFLLAGLVTTLIPHGFLEEYVGSGLPAMLLMVLIGLPFYVCATSSTPVAAVLIAKGLSPGAALVFLLVGPATNIATMVIVGRDLGRRGLILYLISIGVIAVLFGMSLDAVFDSPFAGAVVEKYSHHSGTTLQLLAAVALTLLILNGLRIRTGKLWSGRKARG